MKVMFVCTGNTCRSAMAEGLMKKIVDEKKLDIQVCSAGTFAYSGEHASYNSVSVMKEYDVDIALHKSTNIEESNIKEMDLILCATKEHKLYVQSMYNNLAGKIYTLKEYADLAEDENKIDIKDPWGYDINSYRLCAAEINYCIDKIIEKIEQKG